MLFRLVVVLQFIAFAVCVGVIINFWMDGGSAVSRAMQNGVLAQPLPRTPLTPVEHTIAVDQFAQTWGMRAFPCRTGALLWRDVTDPDWRPPAMPVSQRAATAVLADHRGTSIRWQIRRLIVACQLDGAYDDAQLLRAWLSRAYFGQQTYGVEAAAQAVFGKPAAALTAEEAAKLAVLLRAPGLRAQPDRWTQEALTLQQRVAAQAPN